MKLSNLGAINMPVITDHIYQHNVYMKKMCFDRAETVYQGHHHHYDHVTLVASGKVKVKFAAVPEANLEEEVKEYSGVSMFVTRAFRTHEITALEDNTVVCCVHAVRDDNGEVIDIPSDITQPVDSEESLKKILIEQNKKIERGRAFTATTAKKLELIERAEEEGTLVPGSGDMLI